MGRFWDWLWEPLEDLNILQSKNDSSGEGDPDIKVIGFSKTRAKRKLFRPESFEQYIGQEKIKHIQRRIIKGTQARGITFPHSLFIGSAGFGKTTLARLLAKELNLKFVECIASDLESFQDIVDRIEECENGIFFIDEIHGLERSMCEKLYGVMEDFEWEGVSIPEFCLAGASTELGEIISNRRPFFDRFENVVELQEYSIKELMQILTQYNLNMFPNDILPETTYEIIANNCRGVPRRLIGLLKNTIYFEGQIDDVLHSFNILKDGYTLTDLKILEYLAENLKGVGLNGLSAYLNMSSINYQHMWEPFLLQRGMLLRTGRGRKITELGLSLIKELNELKKETQNDNKN